ncbi:hypothetical protein GCM10017612_19150 [Novosphingobium resinovorum]|nr:hypothetical protein GCM10017612_19150 [Novosphingobium resinovorum]
MLTDRGRFMKIIDLTLLILELNAAIDAGHKADWEKTQEHIEARTVFPWLRKQDFSMDLSFYDGDRAHVADEISQEWQSIYGGYAGSERRKWGVENNGLNLLLAWTNEIIQQKFK